jgi:amino acid transporter
MNRHPFRVTLLYWLVLILSAWNGLRLWTALAWQDVLNEFSASPPPIVTAISGGVWVLVGIALLWAVGQKKPWAWILLIGAASVYSAWYWVERLAWQTPHPNRLFAVIVNLTGMLFILFSARLLSREAHERNIENRTVD